MHVNSHADIDKHHLPGLEHQTLAGGRDGLRTLEVWRQTIDPHAATPVHRHDCEEVIVCLAGAGMCRYAGREYPFRADESLVIPSGVVHQIVNAGDEPLFIIATLGMAPVKVETGEGATMRLPWDSPAA
jgi:mannose-6-phosphate isomerase-like protein (cupin superfamily)